MSDNTQEQVIDIIREEIKRVKHTYLNFERLLYEVEVKEMSIEEAKELIKNKLIALKELDSDLHEKMQYIRKENLYS